MTQNLTGALGWFLLRTNLISRRAKNFRWSKFLHILTQGNLVVVFHHLHPEPVYLQKKVWDNFLEKLISGTLSQKMNNLTEEFIKRKLLVSSDEVDLEEYEKAKVYSLEKLNRPSILYLMLAQGCNFSCSYCPIPNMSRQYGEKLLSFEDAVNGISLWSKHIADYPQDNEPYFLIFYGGEPLLNYEVFEKLLVYVTEQKRLKRLPEQLQMMLCTNGSLLNHRLSKIIASYDVIVAIGIDGEKELNDRYRVYVDSSPSFVGIKNTISDLVECGVKVVASVAITPANVNHLKEYPAFLRNLGVSKFGFNLMKGKALIKELQGLDLTLKEYCRMAAQGVLEGLQSYQGREFYEYQIEKKFSAFANSLPFSLDCTCYGNQLVVYPDGQIGNCPFLRETQGHISQLPLDFRIGKTRVVEEMRKRLLSFELSSGVLNGGGCAWSSFELSGSISAIDEINSLFTKEVINELVWKLLPAEQSINLKKGNTVYWCYRGNRNL